ncbi:hypothetical protein B0H19DRAFT_1061674 [Mycena capillaripes]|nr:hypothetical protein B0H19DRAFT_1061674 [Mycena capillaripes]
MNLGSGGREESSGGTTACYERGEANLGRTAHNFGLTMRPKWNNRKPSAIAPQRKIHNNPSARPGRKITASTRAMHCDPLECIPRGSSSSLDSIRALEGTWQYVAVSRGVDKKSREDRVTVLPRRHHSEQFWARTRRGAQAQDLRLCSVLIAANVGGERLNPDKQANFILSQYREDWRSAWLIMGYKSGNDNRIQAGCSGDLHEEREDDYYSRKILRVWDFNTR